MREKNKESSQSLLLSVTSQQKTLLYVGLFFLKTRASVVELFQMLDCE